jgi:hypothetical protein
MKKPKIVMNILKEDVGYSAYANVDNRSIYSQGDNFNELMNNILDAVNLSFDDKGFNYKNDEIKMKYDLASFFEFYRILNAKALSQRIGMNQSLLAQYISGKKKPSLKQSQRILQGIQKVGRELSEVNFLL